MYEFPELGKQFPSCLSLQCRFCDRLFQRPQRLQAHEESVHGYPTSDNNPVEPTHEPSDHILNYTKHAMTLLLLPLNMNNAIYYGDSLRMFRNVELMYLFFKTKTVNCY